MAYGEFKNLIRRTVSDKILRDKAFNIDKVYIKEYQWDLSSMFYKFFDKKTFATANKFAGIGNKTKNIYNNELAEESPTVTFYWQYLGVLILLMCN